MNSDQIYTIVIITSIVVLATLLLLLAFQRVILALNSVRLQVAQSVVPKFLQISPDTNSLVELAIEVWRLNNRLEKIEA